MKIRIRETGEILSVWDYRVRNPNISFPVDVTEPSFDGLDVDVVRETDEPTVEPWQTAVEDGAEQVNGAWRIKYKLEPATQPQGWLDEKKSERLTYLANRRWQAEVAGVIINGAPIATDRESQAKITAAFVMASTNPDFSVANWKVAPSTFVPLSSAAIAAIGTAVVGHVQACFTNESDLSSAIMNAGDYEALMAIDIDAGWPS